MVAYCSSYLHQKDDGPKMVTYILYLAHTENVLGCISETRNVHGFDAGWCVVSHF